MRKNINRFAPKPQNNPNWSSVLPCIALLFYWPAAQADFNDDIGFTDLQTELGASLPDGAGVKVDQIEAPTQVGQNLAWMPNPGRNQFAGKTINDMTGITPGVYSAHANKVGDYFFGLPDSTTPGILTIDAYEVDDWLANGFLRTKIGGGLKYQPKFTDSRVANHSWIGTTQANNEDILARLDWVIETDDMLHATAFKGSVTYLLLGNAYNVIAVDRTSHPTNGGSQNIGGVYQSGRTKPELVAPDTSASNATPRVSSAIAFLIDAGHNNPSWSVDPVATSKTNRNGDTIYNAERSEVIKAALMAGASRATANTWPNAQYLNITDYRVTAGDRTVNGLDRRYGAGQLQLYNSYKILAAGEQSSIEDNAGSGGLVTDRGFDYDPEFGGANGTNNTATYYLNQSAEQRRLTATLAWNLKVDGGSANFFNGTGTLYDLDLELYDVSDSQNWILVASSASTTDNTENFWLLLDAGKDYALRVKTGAGQTAFNWDYALGWQAKAIPPLTLQINWNPHVAYLNQWYYWRGTTAAGGEPPYSWRISDGVIPWPLELNQNGAIFGVPGVVTAYAYFTLEVSDQAGNTATVDSHIPVQEPVFNCTNCHSSSGF